MGIATRMLKQDAIWWKRTGTDRFGNATYDAPIDVLCRWDERQETFIDKFGQTTTSSAVVYVDRDMDIDDVIMLGGLADITSLDAGRNPLDDEDAAFPVRGWKKIGNLKQTEFLYGCLL